MMAQCMASDLLHCTSRHKLRAPCLKDMQGHKRRQRALFGKGWNSVEDIDGGYQPIVADAALHINKSCDSASLGPDQMSTQSHIPSCWWRWFFERRQGEAPAA